MQSMEWYAVSGFAAIFLFFWVFRSYPILWSVLSLALVLLFCCSQKTYGEKTDYWILSASLLLYVCGLAIFRIMLRRSVSLRMLQEFARGGDLQSDFNISGRLEDGLHYGLLRSSGNMLQLTWFGKAAAFAVKILYVITGQKR